MTPCTCDGACFATGVCPVMGEAPFGASAPLVGVTYRTAAERAHAHNFAWDRPALQIVCAECGARLQLDGPPATTARLGQLQHDDRKNREAHR